MSSRYRQLSIKQRKALMKGTLIRNTCGALAMVRNLEWNFLAHLRQEENLREMVSVLLFGLVELERHIRELDYNKIEIKEI